MKETFREAPQSSTLRFCGGHVCDSVQPCYNLLLINGAELNFAHREAPIEKALTYYDNELYLPIENVSEPLHFTRIVLDSKYITCIFFSM